MHYVHSYTSHALEILASSAQCLHSQHVFIWYQVKWPNWYRSGLAGGISGLWTHGQVKPMTYKIDSCHFVARHLALLGYGKDWLAQCQNNVTEFIISGHGVGALISQWGSTTKSPWVPLLVWFSMLLGHKTTTNKQQQIHLEVAGGFPYFPPAHPLNYCRLLSAGAIIDTAGSLPVSPFTHWQLPIHRDKDLTFPWFSLDCLFQQYFSYLMVVLWCMRWGGESLSLHFHRLKESFTPTP